MQTKVALLMGMSFVAGVSATFLPRALADNSNVPAAVRAKTFIVSIDEVRQNFVFGEQFRGS